MTTTRHMSGAGSVRRKRQQRCGRYFVFEHPMKAMSWYEKIVEEVAALLGVGLTTVDLCAHGLLAADE